MIVSPSLKRSLVRHPFGKVGIYLKARRLVLIKSILFSLQILWSSLFLFPSKVHKMSDAYLRAFLWDGLGFNLKKSKVVWEEVHVPKEEGRSSLMRSKDYNKAIMIKLIWNLL